MQRKRRNVKAVVETGKIVEPEKIGGSGKVDRRVANGDVVSIERIESVGRSIGAARTRKERQVERRQKRQMGKARRWASRAASILTIAAILPVLTKSERNVVWGQISTATEERGAGSLLDSTQPNGRFSGKRYDGATRPALNSEESRFSAGVVRGSAGNVVGVDANRGGGRFSGASEFRSRQNYELFYWRNEIQRAKNRVAQAERDAGLRTGKDDRPQPVVAKEPKSISLAEARRGVRYGRTAEEIEAARRAELAAAQNAVLTNPNAGAVGGIEPGLPAGGEYDPATIWMRGRAPLADFPTVPFDLSSGSGRFGEGERRPDARNWVELDGVLRSEFAGASLAPVGAPLAPSLELASLAPSPEEKRRAYQERLTTLLLQTPAVNPLSPISVEYRDGVATVRGIVPTPSAREAAGRVLLTEPDVIRVENKLTYVRPDDVDGPGELVPVLPPLGVGGSGAVAPNLPKASKTPNTPAAPQGLVPVLPPLGAGGSGAVAPNLPNGAAF